MDCANAAVFLNIDLSWVPRPCIIGARAFEAIFVTRVIGPVWLSKDIAGGSLVGIKLCSSIDVGGGLSDGWQIGTEPPSSAESALGSSESERRSLGFGSVLPLPRFRLPQASDTPVNLGSSTNCPNSGIFPEFTSSQKCFSQLPLCIHPEHKPEYLDTPNSVLAYKRSCRFPQDD